MAVGKVKESVAAKVNPLYIGGAECKVLACNPTKEERNKLIHSTKEEEPVYTKVREENGNKIPQAIITVYVQPNFVIANDNNGEEIKPTIPVSFFLSKEYVYKQDKSKIQVIDDYGYNAWATQEELQNHIPLLSQTGKALKITTSYRPAYRGEAEFVEWVKNYLCIDDAMAYINEEWVSNPEITDFGECEIHYDVEKFFNGDFSEIQHDLKLMPENEFRGVFGVKMNDKGILNQMMYTRKTAKKSGRYSEIDSVIQDQKKNGGLKNVTIDAKPFREFDVKASDLSKPATTAIPQTSPNPFGAPIGAAPTPSTQATPWG